MAFPLVTYVCYDGYALHRTGVGWWHGQTHTNEKLFGSFVMSFDGWFSILHRRHVVMLLHAYIIEAKFVGIILLF